MTDEEFKKWSQDPNTFDSVRFFIVLLAAICAAAWLWHFMA